MAARYTKQKDKMVSFRLTAEEYSRLCGFLSTVGLSSLSELARLAISRLIAASNSEPLALDEQIRNLRERISGLSLELEDLSLVVSKAKGARTLRSD